MRGIPSFVEEILASQEGLLHGHVFYLFIYLHFIYLFSNSTPCLQETIFRKFYPKICICGGTHDTVFYPTLGTLQVVLTHAAFNPVKSLPTKILTSFADM
jgi:hypothetical protein